SSATIDLTTGNLTLDYAATAVGKSLLTIRAIDSLGLFAETSFVVSIQSMLVGTDSADSYYLCSDGASLLLYVNTPTNLAPTYTTPLASLLSLTIRTAGGADSVTVDSTTGSPIPAGGLFIDAGTDIDLLNFAGSGVGAVTLVGGTF